MEVHSAVGHKDAGGNVHKAIYTTASN